MFSAGGSTVAAPGGEPPGPAAGAPAAVALDGIRKTYGDVVAIEQLSLQVRPGEFFTLLGPSGSGKTTTLRVIAGFELADSGTVWLDGSEVTSTPPYERAVNTVFQDYALFPHMSVLDNVAYGLRVRGVPKRERREQAEGALEMVRLPGVGERKPLAALGRAAPAGGARAGAGQPPAGAAARRAPRRPGSEAAPADAARAEGDPARAERRDHLHLRHPRPGRGAHHERPHRRLLRGPHRAGGCARETSTSVPPTSSWPASWAPPT